MNSSDPVVLAASGGEQALGDFLAGMIRASGLAIAEIARRAHLSRSFVYLMIDGRQVPSVESLVSVLEAAGAEGVRPSEPGSPGDIEFDWDGRRRWVRLPDTGRRSARSKNALRTLSSSWAEEAPVPLAPPPPAFAAAPAPAPARAPAAAPARPDRQARTELLGELVHAASNLDEDRLRLLIEHANLLRRGREG